MINTLIFPEAAESLQQMATALTLHPGPATPRTEPYFDARDGGECVITGRSGMLCYILPFSLNSDEDTQGDAYRLFDHARIFLVEARRWKSARALFTTFLNCRNQTWNLICLNQQLNEWWNQGYFGLKCLGIFPKDDHHRTVRIQFRWLSRELVVQGEGISDPELSDDVQPSDGDPSREGTKIEEGDTFDVIVTRREAEMMKTALDLQWAILRIAKNWDAFERLSGRRKAASSRPSGGREIQPATSFN
ncbi:hypothetical protein B0H67DRAFT_608574 [Lasiosphaeris hirsuta]|uniref:HNH nuclease domain-containing protein n=1 Tax=Lasiosphaeris hirsuta TaxID=260670 RepID=A0AA40APT0_9PEZI|nr:hypothetical protein B0H67DRAFT_608574 [Lasiosphaeris hirsuta]